MHHLAVVLLFFATCNHVLLQPVLRPGQTYEKTWPPPSTNSRDINYPRSVYTDMFYKKTVIEYDVGWEYKQVYLKESGWTDISFPTGPCFSCLYYISPVMIQHRAGETNFFDDPKFYPKELEVISKKTNQSILVDVEKYDRDKPFGLVMPAEKCSNPPNGKTEIGTIDVNIDAKPKNLATSLSVSVGTNKLYYKYSLWDYRLNNRHVYPRTLPFGERKREYFFWEQNELGLNHTDIGDFRFRYQLKKLRESTDVNVCDVLITIGNDSIPVLSPKTLNSLPDGNVYQFPKGFLFDYYPNDIYGNAQLFRKHPYKHITLEKDHIKIELSPLHKMKNDKELKEDQKIKTIEFEFFEHPHPMYSAIYTLHMFRYCCVEFQLSLFNDLGVYLKFCNNQIQVETNSYEIRNHIYRERNAHYHEQEWRDFRFFVSPITSDDVGPSMKPPKKPQRIFDEHYNLVIHIMSENKDGDESRVFIHERLKIQRLNGDLHDPTKGHTVKFKLSNYIQSCSAKEYPDKTISSLHIEGPGILMKKPVVNRVLSRGPQPPPKPQVGKYDVTRRTTQSDPTFEPRTDPTVTEAMTTMKTSSASMPMGIIIGIMIALMIIILLWVYFADILCKRKSQTNELLLLEPQPRAHTPLPQSIEDVNPDIKLSTDEPPPRPPKKKKPKKEKTAPPPEKKKIPVPTRAPPRPGRQASEEEPIPNTNGSLHSSIQTPMPEPVMPSGPKPPRTNFITCYEGFIDFHLVTRVLTVHSAKSLWDVLPFLGGPEVPVDGYFFRVFDVTGKIVLTSYKCLEYRLTDRIDMQDVPNWDLRKGVKVYILENDPVAFEIHTTGFEPPEWISKIASCQACLKLAQNNDVPTVFAKDELKQMNECIKALPTCWHMYANYVLSDKPNPDPEDVVGVYVFRTTTDMVLSPAPKSCYHLHTTELRHMNEKELKSFKEKFEDRVVSKVEKANWFLQPSEISQKFQNLSASTTSSKKKPKAAISKTEPSDKVFAKPPPQLSVKEKLENQKLKEMEKIAKGGKLGKLVDSGPKSKKSDAKAVLATDTETSTSTKRTKTEDGSIKTEDDAQETTGATDPNDKKDSKIPPLQGDSDKTIKPGDTRKVFSKPSSTKTPKG